MIIEISVAVIAVAFVVLVIYIIGVTKDLRLTLTRMNQTFADLRNEFGGMGGVAKQALENVNGFAGLAKHALEKMNEVGGVAKQALENLNEMSGQAKHTLEHTNQISFDLKHKIGSLTSLFNAVSQVGEMVDHKISAFKKEAMASSREESHESNLDSENPEQQRSQVHHESIKIADILELAGISIRLWQKLKKRR